MTYKDAKNLKSKDQVRDKKTGEIVVVLSIKEESPPYLSPQVTIEGVGDRQGLQSWRHTEVE